MGSGSTKYKGEYPDDGESYVVTLYPQKGTFKCIMKMSRLEKYRVQLSEQTVTASGNFAQAEDKSGYDLQVNRMHIQTPSKISLILADEGSTKSSLGNGCYLTPSVNLLWFSKKQGTNVKGKQEVVLRYRIPTFTMNSNAVKCDEGPWHTVSVYGKPSPN